MEKNSKGLDGNKNPATEYGSLKRKKSLTKMVKSRNSVNLVEGMTSENVTRGGMRKVQKVRSKGGP